MSSARGGSGTARCRARAAAALGAAAGTIVAALVLLTGPWPAGAQPGAQTLRVAQASAEPGAPLAPGHGRAQLLVLANDGRTALTNVRLGVALDGDAALAGPGGLVIDVDLCVGQGDDGRCPGARRVVAGAPVAELDEPVLLPGLRLDAGARARVRVTATLPASATAPQGATALVSYRVVGS